MLQLLWNSSAIPRKDKCSFRRNEITYLGYVINKTEFKKSLNKCIIIYALALD